MKGPSCPAPAAKAAKGTPGLANILLRHTSASLTVNENADPTVRTDMVGRCRIDPGLQGLSALETKT